MKKSFIILLLSFVAVSLASAQTWSVGDLRIDRKILDPGFESVKLSLGTGLSQTFDDPTKTVTLTASAVLPDGDKGDITVSGGVWTIDNGVVTASKLASTLDLSGFTLTLPADVTRLGSTIDLSGAEVTGSLPYTSVSGLGTLATQNGTITDYLTIAGAAAAYQPLDSDLTSIAALTTTTHGRALLTDADAAASRTRLGLGTLATQNGTITDYLTTATAASTYQPLDTQLTSLAGLTYTGNAGKVVAVNGAENGFELITASGGSSTFLGLTDTPSSYSGQAGKFARVNVGETALEFVTSAASLADGDYGDVTVSGSGSAITIDSGVVSLAKMADLAQDQFIGRTTASTGVPQTATITAAARAVLDDATTADMRTSLGLGGSSNVTFSTVTAGAFLGSSLYGTFLQLESSTYGAAPLISFLGTGAAAGNSTLIGPVALGGNLIIYTPTSSGVFVVSDQNDGKLNLANSVVGELPFANGGTNTKVYTADDTWTNPSPATPRRVFVRRVGGGGGGGSGRKWTNAAIAGGGGGGAGAAVVESWHLTTELSGTESVTVGAGGTGGASQTTNSTPGNPGDKGGDTTFAGLVAVGGNGGGGGIAAGGPGGTTTANSVVGSVSAALGTVAGAAGGTTGAGQTGAATTVFLPTGGGGGAGLNTTGATGSGGAGIPMGTAASVTSLAGGAAGVTGGNGGDGNAGRGSGTGGGGGASSNSGNSGAGGNGGGFGSGGGGGAGARDGTGDSGAGGNGAGGYVLIIVY